MLSILRYLYLSKLYIYKYMFSSVQSLSRVRLFVIPWTAACQASLSITNYWSLPKPMSIGDAIQPSHPLSSPSPPTLNLSQHHGLFQWVSSSHQVAKVTGVSASASFLPKKSQGWSPSEWTGWISLQSKGLSSLLQHHSSKASILRRSAFFTVQLSHPYMITGKTIALTNTPCSDACGQRGRRMPEAIVLELHWSSGNWGTSDPRSWS